MRVHIFVIILMFQFPSEETHQATKLGLLVYLFFILAQYNS